IVMDTMAHIQAEHIGPGLEQRPDGIVIAGSWAQSGHDLHVAVAAHQPSSSINAAFRGGPLALWRKDLRPAISAFDVASQEGHLAQPAGGTCRALDASRGMDYPCHCGGTW